MPPKIAFSTIVWVPDDENAFRAAKVIDIGSDDIKVQFSDKTTRSFPYESVYPAEKPNSPDVDDNCALMFLNQATVLQNLRVRYIKDRIYTYVANILLAINPYKSIVKLYDHEKMKIYNGRSIGSLPPHVFAIGDKAFREMKQLQLSQSIIVSGESGSGKTESVKYIMRYLTTSYGEHSGAIEERLLDSNPLLEAFGNAKTTRNNNSSRFGKFVELHFNKHFKIAGGYISHYLLERTRICHQSKGERNYHIFYQLCCAADGKLRKDLSLNSPDRFEILNKGCTRYFLKDSNSADKSTFSSDHIKQGPLFDIQLDDKDSFKQCIDAMINMGMDEQCRLNVFYTVAAILHLGNIQFEPDQKTKEGGCVVKSMDSLTTASNLLQVQPDRLCEALVTRTMQPLQIGGRRGSMIKVPLKVNDAMYARDALCKTVYVRLFDFLVNTINLSIPPSSSQTSGSYYIGMLDIAGFEYFPLNSFEQFCINYCNERLQQFFNARILRDEQDIYEHEGLGVRHIEYVDNQDCIDLIEVFNQNKKHERLDLPRKSHLKLYREIRDDEGFMIRHFAGAVVYSTAEFIEKNNDAIHPSLLMAVRDGTQSEFLRHLFEHHDDEAIAEGKLNFISVGSKFKSQLHNLIDRLKQTGTSFVRCIKPNDNMKPIEFDGPHILTQLQCAGMLSVLELMQQGFPSRAKFKVLYGLYEKYLPPDVARLEPRFFCKGLFSCLDMSHNDYRFGLTMVFFRPGKFAEFDSLMREDPEHLQKLVNRVRHWLRRARWRKGQYFILTFIRIKNRMIERRRLIILLQSRIRMTIQARKIKFRLAGLSELSNLSSILQQISQLLVNDTIKTTYNELVKEIDGIRNVMRLKDDINEQWTKATLSTISSKVNNLLQNANEASVLHKRKLDEERLVKIRQQLELEKQKKAEMERQIAEDERIAKENNENRQRQEIEQRRKREEERLKQLQSELSQAANEQKEDKLKELLNKKQRQQREIDYHLAQRLAAATGSDIDPLSSIIGLTEQNKNLKPKYDLSSWKYAQLRDTINTSCDMDLLQACRDEFHRRLKAYHLWKSKNKARGAPVERRVPQEIVEAIKNMRAIVGSETVVENEQRFFKVCSNKSNCIWYAHFDGRWICRQLEIENNKILKPMIAGIDDIDMCELALDETDLMHRKNAEILESEFEKIWNENGGLQYMAENYTRIHSKYLQEKARSLVELLEF